MVEMSLIGPNQVVISELSFHEATYSGWGGDLLLVVVIIVLFLLYLLLLFSFLYFYLLYLLIYFSINVLF